MRCLLIDDNVINNKLASKILKMHGAEGVCLGRGLRTAVLLCASSSAVMCPLSAASRPVFCSST